MNFSHSAREGQGTQGELSGDVMDTMELCLHLTFISQRSLDVFLSLLQHQEGHWRSRN